MRPVIILAVLVLALGAVEGLAYWWMHPAPNDRGQPVLCYRPGDRGQGAGDRGQEEQKENIEHPTSNVQRPTADQEPVASDSAIQHPESTTTSYQALPDVYAKAAPMLRCSNGQVYQVTLDESIGLHIAWFEWNDTDAGSVLDAFLHMPEGCMGSIGMTLVAKEKPIIYQVGGESLVFDHTIFREPGQGRTRATPGLLVHAFRTIWVGGMASINSRDEEFERLRTLRFKSALSRYRPAHARVIQGAVRGAPNNDAAWQAFEKSMLVDLKLEPGR